MKIKIQKRIDEGGKGIPYGVESDLIDGIRVSHSVMALPVIFVFFGIGRGILRSVRSKVGRNRQEKYVSLIDRIMARHSFSPSLSLPSNLLLQSLLLNIVIYLNINI